jgi:hypothetical protein
MSPKLRGISKKILLYLIAKFQPTFEKKSTTLVGRHESVFSVFENKLFVQKKKAS